MASEKMRLAEDSYYRAVDALADGDLPTAIHLFQTAIAADASFTDAWHGLIRAMQDSGDLDAALAGALRLAELEPDDVLVHTRLSILYQMQGKIPEAEAESARARVLGWKQQLKNGQELATGNFS